MKPPAQFVKLMMMTTSAHDAEALTAIRKANAMLASANVNWEEFLSAVEQTSTAASPSPPPPHDGFSDVQGSASTNRDPAVIDPMFERAFAKVRPGSGFSDFLDSIHQWWEDKGFLTDRQFQALRKAAT